MLEIKTVLVFQPYLDFRTSDLDKLYTVGKLKERPTTLPTAAKPNSDSLDVKIC